jgi:hypothetical protein
MSGNTGNEEDWTKYKTSIAEVEARSGFDIPEPVTDSSKK